MPCNRATVALTLFAATIGYGLICEGFEQVARSEWAHPVRR